MKLAIRVKWYHIAHLRVNLFSLNFSFNACSHKKCLLCNFNDLYKMVRSRAVYFTQEEQIVIRNSYEEFKNQITARGNKVAHNKAREECWQIT